MYTHNVYTYIDIYICIYLSTPNLPTEEIFLQLISYDRDLLEENSSKWAELAQRRRRRHCGAG